MHFCHFGPIFWLLLLGCFTSGIRTAVIVHTNNTLQGTHYSVQLFYQGLDYPFPNVTGLMTLEENPDNSNNPYIAGNIVLTSLHLPSEPTLRKFQSLGAIAVVMQGYFRTPGVIMYFGDHGDTSDIRIPVSELWVGNYSKFASVLRNTTFISVTLTSSEPNLWKVTFDGPWVLVFQITAEASSLACLLFAIVRMAQFYWFNGGFRINIPQVCFVLTIIGALIRIVGDLDPQGIRQLFNRTANGLLGGLSLPFVFTPYFLLCLFWHEVLTEQSLRVNTFIRKTKLLFYLIASAFFVSNLLTIILRVLDLGIQSQVILAQMILNDIFLGALVIFYTITSIRILKMLSKSEKLSQRKKRTKRCAIILLAGCAGIVFYILYSSTAALMYQAPDGYIVVLWLRTFILSYASFCLLLFFTVPTGNASLTVSGRASESKRSSSVIESGDSMVKTNRHKQNNENPPASNPTVISERKSGNSPSSGNPQESQTDNSNNTQNHRQSQEASQHEKSQSSEENENKQESSSSTED